MGWTLLGSAALTDVFVSAHSQRDDPAPVRDAVWQLLLRGQQAGDAQQGRLLVQRWDVETARPHERRADLWTDQRTELTTEQPVSLSLFLCLFLLRDCIQEQLRPSRSVCRRIDICPNLQTSTQTHTWMHNSGSAMFNQRLSTFFLGFIRWFVK